MEWLKTILNGATITDGVLDTEKLLKDIEAEFPKHAVPKTDFNDVNERLKSANATIETLKKDNADNEALQKEVNGYKEKVKTLEAENVVTKKSYALKERLAASGVLDPDYLIYKHGGIEKFTFDKEGKPVGVDEVLKPYREDTLTAHLFKQKKNSPYNPAGGGGGGETNPFAKETFNMTKQGELLKTNPEQARALAAAAGVKI